MKNYSCKVSVQKIKAVFLSFSIMMLCNMLFAQLAVYPLRTGTGQPPTGTVSSSAPGVNPGTVVTGTMLEVNNYNSAGLRMRTDVSGSTFAWPTSPTDGFGFDIPFSPVTGNDLHITGITFRDTTPDFDVTPTNFFVVPYYQVDGAGAWRILNGATPAFVTDPASAAGVNLGPINETFYSGHTYTIRFYVYGSGSIYKSDYFRVKNLVINGTVSAPPAAAPTVTSTSATATGLHSANVVGSYQFGAAFHSVYYSGWVYSTSTNPAIGSATSDTVGTSGNLNTTLTELAAGTTYYVKAFIITQFGIFYGAELSFRTFPPTPPVVITNNPATNVLSNKATGGGVIVDSGGIAITSKGLVWNTAGGATIASNIGKVILNGNADPFSDLMKQLQPNTRYCYRAFATNALGTSYGADVCFTTGAPVPVLTAIPGLIDFGTNYSGDNPITVSYILTGAFLTPASGNIIITVPANSGFEISTSTSPGSFGNSITLPYTGGTIPRTPIFVRFLTTFGIKSAVITHSGGGVAAADADVVNLRGEVVQSPDDVSNTGTDFFLGFGYEEKMSRKAGEQTECRLSVYVTNPGSQPVRVHCDLTSGGYAQVTTIPAFGSYTFSGFPLGDPNNNTNAGNFPDARLYSTGISNKSIHVYTEQNIPVAVHMHSYTNGNSAAGSIVFPTNTWNSSYTVQAFGGESNNSNPNSFFFVIANQDNTVVTFTPTQPILDASAASLFNENLTTPANTQYAANGTYSVTLNRGQVFNAMGGFSPAGNGMDLSGTKVSTTCDKKITVFGGNGRCFIQGMNGCTSSSGSDHLIQQMFPSVAWGTKYLTAATANTSPNYFRIYFQDPTSVVKVNGTTLTAANLVSVNGTPIYYQYQSDQPLSITSDKPINVTQFMLTPGCTSNSAVDAGPEMMILSPVEQAISNVVFYSPTSGKNIIDLSGGGYTSYMNVIIPSSKVSTFKLDGAAPAAGSFTAHPQDAGYSYARLPVTSSTKHSLTADTGFVAIAYGYGDGESYGFNAGTSIKNLSSIKITDNPLASDTSSTVVRTCVNTPVTLRIALPYPPSLVNRVVWQPGGDQRIDPSTDTTGRIVGGIAEVEDTITVNNRTFYVYKSPVQFRFSANALYNFKVTAYGTFLSDCPGEDQQLMLINVGQDLLNLAANPSCGNQTVPFTADTVPMVGTNILSWEWNFGDGTIVNSGTISPQSHTYGPPPPTAYLVKLTTKNTVGCISTDSIMIDFGGGLEAGFTISKDSVCMNVPVTFTDTSSASGTSGAITSWEWEFGNGVTSTLQSPPPQSYTSPGIKTVSLTVSTPIGCVMTFKDTVVVEATPVAAISPNPTFVCLNDSAAYTDASTIAVGAITTWEWYFDDGGTSSLKNPKHLWTTPGPHTVKLVVKSTGSCASDTATHTINVDALPIASFTYDLNCTIRTISLTDGSNPNGGTINGWSWTFGDGGTSTVQNPTHVYAASGTDTVTLSVITAHGCKSPVPDTIIVTIAASPVADFTLPGNTCLPNASPVFTNTTTISDGTGSFITYVWSYGTTDTSYAKDPTFNFPGTGPYDIKLTATSNQGCTNSRTQRYSAIFAKPAAIITAPTGVCLGNATNFSSASSTTPGSTAASWTWDFGDSPTPGSSNLQNPTYTYNASGPKTVKLTVTSAAGCVSNDTTVSFSVNLSPVASFTYDAIRCEDSVITFTDASTPNGSALVEWKWVFDGTPVTQTTQAPATHTFATSGPKNVSLVVKDANGCSNGTPYVLAVVINPNPVADFNVSNICVGTGVANFTQNVSLASGNIAIWDWDFDVPGSTNGNTATPSFTYTAGGEYNVKLTATSDSSCKHSITKLVKAYTAPTVAFDVNTPSALCSNLPVSIIDRSAVSGYGAVDKIEIYWDNLGASTVKQTVNAPSANSTYSNQYPEFGTPATNPYRIMIRAFNGPGGCSTDLFQDITLLASPKVQFTQPAPICQEAPSFILTGASDVFNLPGSGAYSGDGVSSNNFTPALAGAGTHSITYTYTAANGCIDAESKDIVVDPTPIISFGNQSVINVLEGDVLQLNPKITYGATYLWTPSTYLNNATSPTPSGMPTDDIVYTLLVTSSKGCQETESIPVKVVRKYVVPNTFTPNNDGNHDRWEIENLALYPDVRVRIFSRTGQMVFESYGYNTPWDGKYKGTDCPFGTYYYVIETGGGRSPRTGYVAIIR